MALAGSQTILGNALADALLDPAADPVIAAKIRQQWIQIANIILTHIVANAQVTTKVTGSSATGGPVVGTGTGTVL